MLSVKWEPDCTRISLHRMFLEAPQNVMDSLACYLRREVPSVQLPVKKFIEENLRRMDYSHKLDATKLYSLGNHYNLEEIYHNINSEYFIR